jgi:hypothetical protein
MVSVVPAVVQVVQAGAAAAGSCGCQRGAPLSSVRELGPLSRPSIPGGKPHLVAARPELDGGVVGVPGGGRRSWGNVGAGVR